MYMKQKHNDNKFNQLILILYMILLRLYAIRFIILIRFKRKSVYIKDDIMLNYYE